MPGLESLERLGDAAALDRPVQRRRMLVIANPHATTVFEPLKTVVVHALQSRYEVDAVDTERRDHATALCREAAREGYDVVVAFGGDGTVNEVANGLAGSFTPLSCLPGGATNVYCKILGIPDDIVAATAHLLALAAAWRPRRVDLGAVNGRRFLFSSGYGLDAAVVRRVDAHPQIKRRLRRWYFAWAGLTIFARHYLVHPPQIDVEVGGRTVRGVTALVQTADPYTYWGHRPLHVAEGSELDDGSLAGVVLCRAAPQDAATILARLFARRLRIADHRHVVAWTGLPRARCMSADGRPVTLQVDGDYLGETPEALYEIMPGALSVVS